MRLKIVAAAIGGLALTSNVTLARLAVSANDANGRLVEGVTQTITDGRDTVTVIDLTTSPPRVLASIEAPTSVTGKPLEKSRHWIIKMVTQAENTGQVLEAPVSPGTRWRLSNPGKAPVITKGIPSNLATRISLNNTPIVTLFLENGTWELEMNNGQATLTCDMPDVRAKLQGKEFTTKAIRP